MPGTADRIHLDHVAIAAEHVTDLWPRYAGDLAAGWVGMGPDVGFSFCQLRFGNGRRIEMLDPYDVEKDDFLRRFIDRNGPGPHHITFKVPSIHEMLDHIATNGYHPTRVSFADPEWLEAFLHPKEVPGIVIQIAEVQRGAPETPLPAEPLPPPRTDRAADLLWIGHAVASIDEGMRMFAGVLDGEVTGEGRDDNASWVDLDWGDDGRIRLLQPTHDSSPLAAWLDGRAGRVHHLAFDADDVTGIPDSISRPDGTYEVPPERNSGVRLIIRPR